MWFYGMQDIDNIDSNSNEKQRKFGILTVDQKRLERLINYGFKTVHIFKNYYLIRNYSILCKRKRFSLYRLIKTKVSRLESNKFVEADEEES